MATDFKTYKEYCQFRASEGFQVIPEKLWNALKEVDVEGEFDE